MKTSPSQCRPLHARYLNANQSSCCGYRRMKRNHVGSGSRAASGVDSENAQVYNEAKKIRGGKEGVANEIGVSVFRDYGDEVSFKFKRSPIADNWSSKSNDIVIQWVDIQTYEGHPLLKHPGVGKEVPGGKGSAVPIIKIFGVTKEGHSVMAHVHGFTPYFYCKSPKQVMSPDECEAYRMQLENSAKKATSFDDSSIVLGVVPEQKQCIMEYQGDSLKTYLKVLVSLPRHVPKIRSIIQDSEKTQDQYVTFESNVPFPLRYMVDNDIVGGCWLEILKGNYTIRDEWRKVSRCQLEIDVVFEDVISHSPNIPKWSAIAPLRIMSFDIECMGRAGFFPEPSCDAVIQIASYVVLQGNSEPIAKVVMTLGTCLPITGVDVVCFEREEDLLKAWSRLVQDIDPDIVTGYNVQNFDFTYLIDRATHLRIGDEFAKLSKIMNKVCQIKKSTFSSAAFGTRENKEIDMDGRVVIDMITYMWRNHKMSSYSLNAVSAEFLGMQKEDVHHSIISDLQRGNDEDRHRLALYCLKDSYLPLQLMEKLMVVINYIEMARVTGVPIPYLLSRGQQIKVLSMLYRKGRIHHFIVPVYRRMGRNEEGDTGYEGATVIEPIKGFYDEPIATLDFASLYPSIMQAHNLCYTTLLAPNAEKALLPTEYIRSPNGNCFVSSTKKKGILPGILDELLAARKLAKSEMKEAKDPLTRAVMNGRQLALKISANSVYGFTGATIGSLPCLAISASVTAYGREMINQTKEAVEKEYTIENGFSNNAQVIYGDTDSVMVKFGVKTIEEAMKLGKSAAELITKKLFISPISLEFEKVYYPYLLMNKKRYAGMFWTNPEKPDKMDCKGIETVRRDNCGLVRTVIGTVLRKILHDHSVSEATEYVKDTIAALLQNKIDISLLIITKSLSARTEDYSAKQAHVELAARMRKRDAGSAPVIGDRVPYVIIQAEKGAPNYMKSEDPIYVLENNIPIDFQYYLANQLRKPLLRIFGPILSNPESLLSGEHTRSIYIPTPSTSTGIMKFAVMKEKCQGCNTAIQGKGGLCKHCDKNRDSIYLDRLDAVNELEQRFCKLWTQCQRCQESMHQDVLCTSRDCPIFYMRKKVQFDLLQANKKLGKLVDLSF